MSRSFRHIARRAAACAVLAAVLLIPSWEKRQREPVRVSALLPDTLVCSVLSERSLYGEDHAGYLHELFKQLEGYGRTKVMIFPESDGPLQWERLAAGEVDLLIINAARDTVPEPYQDGVICGIPLDPNENVCVAGKEHYRWIQGLNFWFASFRQTPEYAKLLKKHSGRYGFSGGSISPYDQYIRQYSLLLEWDWRLLASLIYQESRFKTAVSSDRGAVGLMQIKPSVAEKYGVEDIYDPEQNIYAGVLHLSRLQELYRKMGADSLDLVRLTLAAYNCGEGRMEDCMELARQQGMNPVRWADLETVIPLLRKKEYYTREGIRLGVFNGGETLRFVSNILSRYEKYAAFPLREDY